MIRHQQGNQKLKLKTGNISLDFPLHLSSDLAGVGGGNLFLCFEGNDVDLGRK